MKDLGIFLVLLSIPFLAFSEEQVNPNRILNSDLASNLATEVINCGRKNNWKLSVTVVNGEGNIIAFRRDDSSYVGSIQASMDKARSANAFNRPTSAFSEALNTTSPRLGLLTVEGVVGIEGGQPIKNGETLLGALGVSGARSVEDDQCAKDALKAFGF